MKQLYQVVEPYYGTRMPELVSAEVARESEGLYYIDGGSVFGRQLRKRDAAGKGICESPEDAWRFYEGKKARQVERARETLATDEARLAHARVQLSA